MNAHLCHVRHVMCVHVWTSNYVDTLMISSAMPVLALCMSDIRQFNIILLRAIITVLILQLSVCVCVTEGHR